jgi:ATP-dependent Clp protease ATP-binding subunit ClpA
MLGELPARPSEQQGAPEVPSFSTTLEQSIHGALALANARRHELATLEHLLLALIDEPDAARVMQACSVNLDELRKDLEDFISDDLSTLETPKPCRPPRSSVLFSAPRSMSNPLVVPKSLARTCLSRSLPNAKATQPTSYKNRT